MILFAFTYITIKSVSLLSKITYYSGKWIANQIINYYYDYNRIYYPILIDNDPYNDKPIIIEYDSNKEIEYIDTEIEYIDTEIEYIDIDIDIDEKSKIIPSAPLMTDLTN